MPFNCGAEAEDDKDPFGASVLLSSIHKAPKKRNNKTVETWIQIDQGQCECATPKKDQKGGLVTAYRPTVQQYIGGARS